MEIEILGILFKAWHLWFIAGIVLIIAEIFAPGFVLGCIAIGCIGGIIADLLGASLAVQIIASSVLALICFLTIRPLVLKTMHSDNSVKTNVDNLTGRNAEVTMNFNPNTKMGRVKIDGDDWRAETPEALELKAGEIVKIQRVESNTLIVKPI